MSKEIISGGQLTLMIRDESGADRALGKSTSCTLTRLSETKERGWRRCGPWVRKKVTRKSWSIEAEGLIPSEGDGMARIEQLFESGGEVVVVFGDSTGRVPVTYTGKAIITRLTYVAQHRRAATIGIGMTGTGAVHPDYGACGSMWDDTALWEDAALWVE